MHPRRESFPDMTALFSGGYVADGLSSVLVKPKAYASDGDRGISQAPTGPPIVILSRSMPSHRPRQGSGTNASECIPSSVVWTKPIHVRDVPPVDGVQRATLDHVPRQDHRQDASIKSTLTPCSRVSRGSNALTLLVAPSIPRRLK